MNTMLRSALLAGNLPRAPDGDAGGAAGGAGAAGAASAAIAAGAAAAAGVGADGAAAGGGAPASWFKDLDPSYHTAITAKGWDKLAPGDATKALADSYFNLEKLMGADKAGRAVVPPKDDAPQTEKDAFYAKLGRPEKPDGYAVKLPDGAPSELLKASTEQFHKLGLSKAQGEALAQWYLGQEKSQVEAFNNKSAADWQQLQIELGAKFPDAVETARRGATALGFDAGKLLAMEQALGTTEFTKMLMKVGESSREISSPGNSSSGTAMGGLTAASAKSRIDTLKTDSDFQARLRSPNAKVREEAGKTWEELHRAAYPE